MPSTLLANTQNKKKVPKEITLFVCHFQEVYISSLIDGKTVNMLTYMHVQKKTSMCVCVYIYVDINIDICE